VFSFRYAIEASDPSFAVTMAYDYLFSFNDILSKQQVSAAAIVLVVSLCDRFAGAGRPQRL
jgi:hypothetical protein